MLRPASALLAAAALAVASAAPAFAVSGGAAVPRNADAPWMAVVAFKGDAPLPQRLSCGGVLISPTRVATAGHCLDHVDPSHLEVHVAGRHGSSTLSSDPGTVYPVKGVAVAPGYRLVPSPQDPDDFSASAAANDAGIIVLDEPVRGVPTVPVARHDPRVGAKVSAYGHGITAPVDPNATDPTSVLGDTLSRADLGVIGDRSCDDQLDGVVDGATVLCARSSTEAICEGDSGGPLLHEGARGPELVGLVSFGGEVVGKGCQAGPPAGFADASALHPFLTQRDPVLAPMPGGRLTIKGERTEGSTLTCEQPVWKGRAPDSVTYEWSESRTEPDGFTLFLPVDGATGPSLKVTKDLAAHQLECTVEATTAGGTVYLQADPV